MTQDLRDLGMIVPSACMMGSSGVAGSVGRRAWGTIQEEVGRDLVAPGPPPLGGWPFAPRPLDTWCLGFSACLALLRRVVVVWRPYSRSSPSWRSACQGRYIAALRRLMTFFPCRPPSGRSRAGRGQSLRGGPLRGSGWLRPSAGPSKAPGPRALVTKAPGPQGPGQTRRHQGPRPWSSARPSPGATTGVGCAQGPPAVAARAKTETDSVAILVQ